MRLRTTLLWIVIGSFIAAAGLGILVIILPDAFRAQEEILGTVAILGGMSLPALGCSIVLDRCRLRALMWCGIIAAFVGFGVWMLFMWFDPWRWTWPAIYDEDELIEFGVMLTTGSAWACHFGLISMLAGVRPVFRWSQRLTLVFTTLVYAMAMVIMWFEWEDDIALRFISVLGIVAACGTLVTPILFLIELIQRRGVRESMPASFRIELTCPRCKSTQQLTTGSANCTSCGLRIDVQVEEPRCACGYLLYQLTGDKCPECGRSIPERDRWAARQIQDA